MIHVHPYVTQALQVLAWAPLVVPAEIVFHEWTHWLVATIVGAQDLEEVLHFDRPLSLASFTFSYEVPAKAQPMEIVLAPKVMQLCLFGLSFCAHHLATDPPLIGLCRMLMIWAAVDFVFSTRDWRYAWDIFKGRV